MRDSKAFRGTLAGLAGGLAWFVGIIVCFGPAQSILGDPALQSAKFLAAFTEQPLPRTADAPWILLAGLSVIGILWGWVYTWLATAWQVEWWWAGLRFALIAWVLMVPWFEFYLPWNVMHEPWPLVALEMACWAGVMTFVGLAIAGVERSLRR